MKSKKYCTAVYKFTIKFSLIMANKNRKKKRNANKTKHKDISQGHEVCDKNSTIGLGKTLINQCIKGAIKSRRVLKVYNDYIKRGLKIKYLNCNYKLKMH